MNILAGFSREKNRARIQDARRVAGLSMPAIIAAGKTQDYSTSLAKNAAAPAATTETVDVADTPKKSAFPGFGAVLGIAILGTVLCMRKQKS
jgi:hypothetical protein